MMHSSDDKRVKEGRDKLKIVSVPEKEQINQREPNGENIG
jgi:hypothetical protein